ncbi:Complement component 1 Q subcomponent-binding pro tein, mitochondrial [Trichuris trichiura]|uniref:Complement component 1 Q subcomponent-binding pro tein, mitochondrial n=1 Tax=Trichuris trichiura TaxID=36087 RepID=A0A077ZC92_TRITR|nr:Complement component 1 Q subcomponent-binding pro tein, mitochondrial [Trichuris trichiura]
MLADFLKEEIEAEKKLANQQLPNGIVPSIPGFQITADDDEVTLTKKLGKETVIVKFHVSNSVDTSMDSETPDEKSEQAPVVVSKPNFTVSIVKENQHLIFECEFIEPFGDEVSGDQPADDVTDMFNIEEIYIHDGDANEKTYSVRGEIIDGGLYDHLMTYLEERGVDNAFAEHLIRFATHYEHAQYVALLQGIRDFVDR